MFVDDADMLAIALTESDKKFGLLMERDGLEVSAMKVTRESVCPACGGTNGDHRDNCPFKKLAHEDLRRSASSNVGSALSLRLRG